MKSALAQLYTWLFARPVLFSLNQHLFKLSLRGLGILNSENEWATGEPWFMQHLQKTDPPKVVIDVGANDVAYGADVFTKATIYAFEPTPASFKRLQQKAPAHVKPVNAAVGSTDDMVTLYDFADDAPLKGSQPTSQLNTVHPEVMTELYRQPTKTYQVKQVLLDSFAEKNKIRTIDLLKIDAEGNELAVLQGAQKLLAAGRIRYIQFEFNQMAALTGTSMFLMRKQLAGYTLYRLLPNGMVPLGEYQPILEEIYGFQNIVAIRTTAV